MSHKMEARLIWVKEMKAFVVPHVFSLFFLNK